MRKSAALAPEGTAGTGNRIIIVVLIRHRDLQQTIVSAPTTLNFTEKLLNSSSVWIIFGGLFAIR
jgi:hypothetical protein